jgi:heme-degrading monooxygenase HmoA
MIARLWSARTTPALAPAYLRHFENAVRPELGQMEGFLGSSVCTRTLADVVEILVTTYWRSMEEIEDFAGPDREAAVVAEEAAALLKDYDRRVRHYTIASAQFPAAT